VLALAAFGQTLNINERRAGLAIAVGLIIDDAIVVIEASPARWARTRKLTDDRGDRLHDAPFDRSMTASTLTTVVVFVPLAMLGGVTGSFFRALALTLSSALIVSLA